MNERIQQALEYLLDLPYQERVEVLELLKIADDLWLAAQGAPPLADDPTAKMLGLVAGDAEAGTSADSGGVAGA
jgi:hypothetical protein